MCWGFGGGEGGLFVFFIPNESSHTQPKKKLRIISALITVIRVCRLHTGGARLISYPTIFSNESGNK